MTPMERLLAEELPTGTFGDAPQQRRTVGEQRRVSHISAIQAAANRRALEEALCSAPKANVRDLTAYSDIHARRAQRRTRRTAA